MSKNQELKDISSEEIQRLVKRKKLVEIKFGYSKNAPMTHESKVQLHNQLHSLSFFNQILKRKYENEQQLLENFGKKGKGQLKQIIADNRKKILFERIQNPFKIPEIKAAMKIAMNHHYFIK